jgi:hypothetical protein
MSNQFDLNIIQEGYQEELSIFFDEDEPHSGNMSLKLSYGPDIWKSLQVLGNKNEITIIYDKLNERVVATAICSLSNVYFHGKLIKLLYVSGLKVGLSYRNTIVVVKLLKSFKSYWLKAGVELILFSVFSSNNSVIDIFSRKSKVLPLAFKAGELNTYVFKKRILPCQAKPDFKISFAQQSDVADILQFIELEGMKRSNMPKYTAHELLEGSGLLEGFDLSELAIARYNKEVIGIMGLWDQTRYRQWLVTNYSNMIGFIRPMINVVASLIGYPRLPPVNNSFSYKILSLMICKNSSDNTFKHLFNYLMKHDHHSKANYGITLVSDSPLNRYFKSKSIAFSSILYKATYPEKLENLKMLNFNNLYVEQGRL